MTFDPYSLPDAPIVAIDLALDATGEERATVDGQPVRRRFGESARAAAVRMVATLVDDLPALEPSGRRPAGVRARINGSGFRDYDIAVDRDARLYVPIGAAADVPSVGPAPAATPPPYGPDLRSPGRSEPSEPSEPSGPSGPPRPTLGATPGDPVPRGPRGWSRTFLDDRADQQEATASATGTTAATAGAAPAGPVRSRRDGKRQRRRWGRRPPPDGLIATPPRPLSADRLTGLVQAARDLRPVTAEPEPDGPTRGESAADPAQPHRRRTRPAVVAVVLAALLIVGAIAAIVTAILEPDTLRAGSASGTAETTAFPGSVAPGWSTTPRWVSPTLEEGGGRVLAVDDAVAYVTADHRLEVVDALTGAPRWRAQLPKGDLRGGLAFTTIGGTGVVAAQLGDTLAWWQADDGSDRRTLALPQGARTTYLGESPLVGIDERTVAVLSGGKLAQVAVPAGAYALAADNTGPVTAGSGAGWFRLTAGAAATKPTAWERAAPDDDAPNSNPTVIGYLGDSVVTVYPADRNGDQHVVVYTDAAEGPTMRVSFRGKAVATDGAGQPWWPSPAGTWGVLGRTLIDLEAGSVTDLGAWTTTWITQDRAYGTVDGESVQAGPKVERTQIGADVTIPEIVTDAGAAARARVDDQDRLYLLPPA